MKTVPRIGFISDFLIIWPRTIQTSFSFITQTVKKFQRNSRKSNQWKKKSTENRTKGFAGNFLGSFGYFI